MNVAIKVFVQIASYRDPQLVTTVENLLSNADRPELFTFGICWQYGPEENPDYFDDRPGFRVSKHPHKESRGLCWARSITNSLYEGEELTLQIDSHHRFAKGWDTLMLLDYTAAALLSPKPILTTYLPPYDPSNEDYLKAKTPTLMSQYKINRETKLLSSMPWYIQNHIKLYQNRVVRARTISGHFYLVNGSFINRVPYDSKLYFGGEIEEVSMSLRAWTHGYDFFSPTRDAFAWHEYTRNNRPKHWNDHEGWGTLEKRSRKRFDILVGRVSKDTEDDLDADGLGLGKERSLSDYKSFTGIDLDGVAIQTYTMKVLEPPNTTDDQSWDRTFA